MRESSTIEASVRTDTGDNYREEQDMRLERGRRSQNIEDRRGARPGARPGGRRVSSGRGMKVGGVGGIVVVLIGLFLGVDLSSLMSAGGAPQASRSGQVTQSSTVVQSAEDAEAERLVSVVLADTEDVWTKLFQQAGQRYQRPKLVVFSDGVQSACGFTSSAAGPFYCPGDNQVYIDLGFFRQLKRMGAGGDFAQAYVVAHEVGHHIQNLLGVSMEVQRMQRRLPKAQANVLSVKTELQADCYAGVWAHHAHKDRQLLEPGDLEEGMNAAASIGDDVMMARAGAPVRPERFTHGTAEQRQKWLYIGLESGDPTRCDTLSDV